VVAFSADPSAAVREAFERLGVARQLLKPVRIAEVLRAIHELAPGRRGHRTGVLRSARAPAVPPTIVALYLENRERDLRALADAVRRNDLATVKSIAHTIRGSGASYGFSELSELGVALEDAATRGDLASVSGRIDEIRSVVRGERANSDARHP